MLVVMDYVIRSTALVLPLEFRICHKLWPVLEIMAFDTATNQWEKPCSLCAMAQSFNDAANGMSRLLPDRGHFA